MKWEYKTFYAEFFRNDPDKIIDHLNMLGLDGWELVNVHYDLTRNNFYLKRPLK